MGIGTNAHRGLAHFIAAVVISYRFTLRHSNNTGIKIHAHRSDVEDMYAKIPALDIVGRPILLRNIKY